MLIQFSLKMAFRNTKYVIGIVLKQMILMTNVKIQKEKQITNHQQELFMREETLMTDQDSVESKCISKTMTKYKEATTKKNINLGMNPNILFVKVQLMIQILFLKQNFFLLH